MISGSILRKGMWRPGVLVLTDERVRVWHRSALVERTTELHDYGSVAAESVDVIEVAKTDDGKRADIRFLKSGGDTLLSVGYQVDVHADIAAAVQRWAEEHHIPQRGAEIERLSQKARKRGQATLDTITLRDYREEAEAVIERIVEVLTAHEAELLRLRQEVDALRRQAGDP
jgi:hypothetical protein